MHTLTRSFKWLLSTTLTLSLASCTSSSNDLAAGFANPPQVAKPQTWWHWVSGNVSKPGITADLEAMQRVGLGGAQMFTVDQSALKGPVRYMSPQWRDLTKYAIDEAHRLGLKLSIVDCEGWSESGGPWITPALSMQKVVWSEQHVTGPKQFDGELPQPETVKDYYSDIGVWAFPSLPDDVIDLAALKPVLTTSDGGDVDAAKLFDRNPETSIEIPASAHKPSFLLLTFQRPIVFGSCTVGGLRAHTHADVQISDDGKHFQTVSKMLVGSHDAAAQTAVFDEISTRFVRIFVPRADAKHPLTISEISIGGTRIPDFRAKSGMQPHIFGDTIPTDTPSASHVIARDKIIDLSSRCEAKGNLRWDVPAGDWTIVRLGHTSTGITNHPVMKETQALECDKMNPIAVRAQFDGMLAKVIADNKPLIGNTLKYVLMDSWEAGCENWTPKFREEFQKRRGYDPTPYLLAMTGRYVQSAQTTERFLWDVRRTIADLIAENHYGLFRTLAHENKMELTAEATGIGMSTISDELQCKGNTDLPMGEFWVGRPTDNADPKEAASAAHIFGTNIAGTESFTSTPDQASWKNDPFSLKQQGDEEYCIGVNRFIFHRYAHQPWLDRVPGMTMGPWGINFERTNTWFEQARAWITYLSRCQYMLQRGKFVADLCYYYGQGAPIELQPARLHPAPPEGYDYDGCDSGILLNHMHVKDGRIVLDSGMSYRVLVLPDADRMTPQVAMKIEQLVRDGATVYGPRPVGSPSLDGYPQCDQQVKQIADVVWANCDGKTITEHRLGKGRIVSGKPIEQLLAPEPMDFSAKGADPDSKFMYIHRRDGDKDIYFVSSQQDRYAAAKCTFRIAGKAPQLWHADTGLIEPAPAYIIKNGLTTIPLQFNPSGSVFVVFSGKSAKNPIVSLADNSTPLLATPVASTAAQAKIRIVKAIYGSLDDNPDHNIDVTKKLAADVRDGQLNVRASNALTGEDPDRWVVKKLRVDYVLDGKPSSMTVGENQMLNLPASALDFTANPRAELVNVDGKPALQAYVNGQFTVKRASGKTQMLDVASVPAVEEIPGPWLVRFQAKRGAPPSATLDSLISWDQHPDPGIKYFSGTATYLKDIDIPASDIASDKRLLLDLGEVKNLAEVSLNGHNLGILWKPPFRVDITATAHAGANHLEIKVTNLWPNRLIGDQFLPENQRVTWTTFNPYTKDSPTLRSGLLGPVRLLTTVIVPIGG